MSVHTLQSETVNNTSDKNAGRHILKAFQFWLGEQANKGKVILVWELLVRNTGQNYENKY